MGGSWEPLIGVARKILESMLLENGTRLTHEVLCTLMAEVVAIMNRRPLVPVSKDPLDPFILTPSMLLTQKVGTPLPSGDFRERPPNQAVETSTSLDQHVLAPLETSVLVNFTRPEKMDQLPPKSARRRCHPPQGHPSCPQQLPYDDNHKGYPWRRQESIRWN